LATDRQTDALVLSICLDGQNQGVKALLRDQRDSAKLNKMQYAQLAMNGGYVNVCMPMRITQAGEKHGDVR